jgi:glycerol-3-phosphate dehydrogenase
MAPRLCGRYGSAALQLAASAPEWLTPVQGTPYLWAELIWAAQNEAIVHLDDLLLRRSRLGILLADGGLSLLPGLKKWLQKSLGWDDAHWIREVERYWSIWQIAHGLPPGWRE